MRTAECSTGFAFTFVIAASLALPPTWGCAAPLNGSFVQAKDHGSTRPEAPPVEADEALPTFAVDVLVRSAGKPLAGQEVVASQSKHTVETETTGSDGIAHFILAMPGKYVFSAMGAGRTAHRRFTVKMMTPPAPQTFTLALKPQHPA